MPSADIRTLVVLTANRSLFHQISAVHDGLTDRFAPLHVEWMPDPMRLFEARTGEARTGTGRMCVVAVVLDLTVQHTAMQITGAARRRREGLLKSGLDDAGFIWQVAAMLALVEREDRIPLLLVSENCELDRVISCAANSVVRRIEPQVGGDVWTEAISELMVVALRSTHNLEEVGDLSPFARHAPSPARLITLSSEVQVDLNRWIVLRDGTHVPLTAQEIRVLDVLLHAPRHFLSADDLARRMTRPDGYPADEHCVRQTICELRRKLGDTETRPRMLVNRRGLGYALIIEDASHLGSHELSDVLAAHVVSC